MLRLTEEEIFFLLEHPPFARKISGQTLKFYGRNPVCGDQITGELLIKEGMVTEIFVDASGCVISKLATYVWLQQTIDRPIESVISREPPEIFHSIGEIIVARQPCALLGPSEIQKVLKRTSENFRRSQIF